MLADAAANTFARADGALCLDGLLTWGGDIPEWRSESLTLTRPGRSRAGPPCPVGYPRRLTFGGASRELGQNGTTYPSGGRGTTRTSASPSSGPLRRRR